MTRATKEEFIEKSIAKHGKKYSYEKVDYIKNSVKVCITCPHHGDFWQTPGNHCYGYGCIKCANEASGDFRRSNTKDFIVKANKKYNNKYDYILTEYKNNSTKVKIICPEHGLFEQTPANHLHGFKCAGCASNKTSNSVIENLLLPKGVKAIPLNSGEYTLVDEDDYETLIPLQWGSTTAGYASSGKFGYMHRFIMGVTDPKIQIDHIDLNKLNNCRNNLRLCNNQQNMHNTPPRGNTSKYKGVSWISKVKKWKAAIRVKEYSWNKHYTDEVEAAKAYDEKAREYQGEFAYLNFP